MPKLNTFEFLHKPHAGDPYDLRVAVNVDAYGEFHANLPPDLIAAAKDYLAANKEIGRAHV